MAQTRSKLICSAEPTSSSYLAMLGLASNDLLMSTKWITDSIRFVSALWPLLLLFKLCLIAVTVNLSAVFADMASASLSALALVIILDIAICAIPRLPSIQSLMPHSQMQILSGLVLTSGLLTTYWFNHLPPPILSSLVPPAFSEMTLALLALSILGGRPVLCLFYCIGAGIAVLGSQGLAPALSFTVFLMAMTISTLTQARLNHNRRRANHRANIMGWRSVELLHEYEEAGRGWFWETDRAGLLVYISETLAMSLGISQARLLGRPMTDLIAVGDRMASDGDRTLGFHLSARTSFSDLPVRVALTHDERWWSISGRPIVNEFGQFLGFRGSGSDLTEMRRHQVEINRLAQYDSLTGLPNRVQMLRTLEQAVVDHQGGPGECALFLLDLDRFKSVNDTMGHPAGDTLLRQVSQRLQQVIGNRGRVGRLGGDEFKVVLPGIVDQTMLSALAEAIIATLSQPYDIEGSRVVIGASIGIALCPLDGITTDALIRNADLALYAAKDDGRGVHRFYSSEMHADAEDRRQLEEDLRHALANDGLSIVYQPVVNAVTEQITGFEALLRWDHPTRGNISPAHFIPIAEDTGLITQIGEWVLRTACQDAAQWPDPIRVAVNVSPIQFANPSLPSIIVNALATANLQAQRLELEITESVFLNDDDSTDAMFSRLKSLGVRLALDDFGTGYSSLGYLKKAPFDKIKIDQSFVRGAVEHESRNAAIIQSIVSLAEALNMETTAEGVETHDELDLIRMLGCSHIQGHIYGRGMKAAETQHRFAEQGLTAQAHGFKSSRPPRRTILRSVLAAHDGQRYSGRIRNVSSQGALIEGLWNMSEGTNFTIEIGNGLTVNAISRWSIEDRVGVQFAETIDLRELNRAPDSRMAS